MVFFRDRETTEWTQWLKASKNTSSDKYPAFIRERFSNTVKASQNWRSFLNREEMTRDFPDVFSCFSFTSFCQEQQLSNLQFFDGIRWCGEVISEETLLQSILSMKRGLVFCQFFVLAKIFLFWSYMQLRNIYLAPMKRIVTITMEKIESTWLMNEIILKGNSG